MSLVTASQQASFGTASAACWSLCSTSRAISKSLHAPACGGVIHVLEPDGAEEVLTQVDADVVEAVQRVLFG